MASGRLLGRVGKDASLPLVSIIVPVYNHESYVAECLDSIILSSYSNVEIIVIDDASSDTSVAAVDRWIEAHREAEVVFRVHAANRGLLATLNEGVGIARGEYIFSLASDDRLLPGGTLARVQFLEERPDLLAVFADCRVIDGAGRQVHASGIEDLYAAHGMRKNALTSPSLIEHAIVFHWAVPGPVLLCRRKAFEIVGLYDETLTVEDWDLYLRLARTKKLGFVDEFVSEYRVHTHCSSMIGGEGIARSLMKTARKHFFLHGVSSGVELVSKYLAYRCLFLPKGLEKYLGVPASSRLASLARRLWKFERWLDRFWSAE